MRNSCGFLPSIMAVVLFSTGGFGQAPAPTPQADLEVLVPEGTVIPIVLSAYLNSRSSQVGDSFYADTVYPVWIQQRLVIPRGTTVKGTVTNVVRPGKIKGTGRLAVRLDSLVMPNGVTRDLVASFRGLHGAGPERIDRGKETIETDGSKGRDVAVLAGTTSQGTMIGAIVDHGTGAAIGAGAGAAAGIAYMLFTRGRDLVLPPGTQFEIELQQPLRFAFAELEFSPAETRGARRAPAARPLPEPDRSRPYFPGRIPFPPLWLLPWP